MAREVPSTLAKGGGLAQRILVVDDEPIICDSIRRLLAADGHAVEMAVSGRAALDLFQKGRFDLIIVDYEMPGMNGDELAAAIKARNPHQRVVLITGHAESLASSGNPLTGVDLVIAKPFDLQELRNAVAKVLPKA